MQYSENEMYTILEEDTLHGELASLPESRRRVLNEEILLAIKVHFSHNKLVAGQSNFTH